MKSKIGVRNRLPSPSAEMETEDLTMETANDDRVFPISVVSKTRDQGTSSTLLTPRAELIEPPPLVRASISSIGAASISSIGAASISSSPPPSPPTLEEKTKKIQNFWRARVTVRQRQAAKQERAAATKLQAATRSVLARGMLKQVAAAGSIQKAIRGRSGRMEVVQAMYTLDPVHNMDSSR